MPCFCPVLDSIIVDADNSERVDSSSSCTAVATLKRQTNITTTTTTNSALPCLPQLVARWIPFLLHPRPPLLPRIQWTNLSSQSSQTKTQLLICAQRVALQGLSATATAPTVLLPELARAAAENASPGLEIHASRLLQALPADARSAEESSLLQCGTGPTRTALHPQMHLRPRVSLPPHILHLALLSLPILSHLMDLMEIPFQITLPCHMPHWQGAQNQLQPPQTQRKRKKRNSPLPLVPWKRKREKRATRITVLETAWKTTKTRMRKMKVKRTKMTMKKTKRTKRTSILALPGAPSKQTRTRSWAKTM
ncbi:hypothetical protein V8B97DRAFT_1503855 [Scleroderma yunnanense]